ncbi:peptidoglycan-binding protein [Leptolyngbya sp. FACHB-36]|uniref:peptidoglycan-binding domain-containing protein n=1 Tax=Leptolyngbya sp. FACHB-36 TaxID=2692808 RepID=UPI001680ABC9|nr:peptidoglycan-binding protein [Leptolyngbya sp. FACHB-36]MBD2022395.1 peptidoglycan-binding protein [Leptolyngbya sp. FACHB-36]
MAYTNAQFRSILNGHGFSTSSQPDVNFPISSNEGPLTDKITVDAIKAFQTYFKLKVDGIAGPITIAKAEQAMRVLQDNLNRVIKANIPANQPFYGPRTVAAVKEFERLYKFNVDGIANLAVRQRLNELARVSAA